MMPFMIILGGPEVSDDLALMSVVRARDVLVRDIAEAELPAIAETKFLTNDEKHIVVVKLEKQESGIDMFKVSIKDLLHSSEVVQ